MSLQSRYEVYLHRKFSNKMLQFQRCSWTTILKLIVFDLYMILPRDEALVYAYLKVAEVVLVVCFQQLHSLCVAHI